MTKPLDLDKGHPDFGKLKSFTRGMTKDTIHKRFGIDPETVLTHPDFPVCPECGKPTKIRKLTLHDGELVVYFLQCSENETNQDHGFGKFSKHGCRAPMGRKGGPVPKKEVKHEDTPAPTPAPNPKPVPDKVVHPEVVRACKYIIAGERQIYLSGPAGTGKSTATEHMMEILKGYSAWKEGNLYLQTVSMSTFVSDLAGFLDRLDGGKFVMSELVQSLMKAGLTVIDEADKGNPNLAGFWNTVLANNKITTPGGTFDRHPDNVVVFIGNTTGHAPSKQYSGSVRQDFATLDRFRVFRIDFREEVERAAISNLNEELFSRVQAMRKRAEEKTDLQRIIGLRWLRRVNMMLQIDGMKPKDALLKTMNDEGWSNDEILASGVNEYDKPAAVPKPAGGSKYY